MRYLPLGRERIATHAGQQRPGRPRAPQEVKIHGSGVELYEERDTQLAAARSRCTTFNLRQAMAAVSRRELTRWASEVSGQRVTNLEKQCCSGAIYCRNAGPVLTAARHHAS